MKKFFRIIFALNFIFFISLILLKADWEPFPLGQTSYFVIKNYLEYLNSSLKKPLSDYIVKYNFDSLENSQDGSKTYFASRLRDYKIYKNCDSLIINEINRNQYNLSFRFDSISLRNDTLFYSDRFSTKNFVLKFNSFYIPLHMKEFDLIEEEAFFLKDKGIKYELILPGLYDSVKTYGIKQKDGNQKIVDFKISKNYGIIQFYPFRYILNNDYENNISHKLLGIKSQNEKYGSTPELFGWIDFFTLKVGDEKYWLEKGKNYPWAYIYSKEKILDIKQNDDSLVISKYITKYNSNIKQYDNYTSKEIYYFDDLVKLKEKNDNEIFVSKRSQFGDDNTQSYNIETGGGMLFMTLPFLNFEKASTILNSDGSHVNPDCKIGFATDSRNSMVFSPNVGFSYLASEDFFRELVGYTQDGVLYGECPQPLSIDDSEINLSISIFPSPATDYINVDMSFLRMQESEIKVYNIFGECVLVAQTPSSEQRIDVSSLPAGIYFLKLNNQKPVKFVKL